MKRRTFLAGSGGILAGGFLSRGWTGNGIAGAQPQIADPLAVTGDRLVVSSPWDGSVAELDSARHLVSSPPSWSHAGWCREGLGTGPGAFNYPSSAAFAPDGVLWVADPGNRRVQLLGAGGEVVGVIGGTSRARFAWPRHVAVDRAGCGWVCDAGLHRVMAFSASGEELGAIGGFGLAGGRLNGPRAAAFAPGGELHVVDGGNRRIKVFDSLGRLLRSYGDPHRLVHPRSLVVDATGSSWVADPAAAVVWRFDRRGHALVPWVPRFGDGRGAQPLALDVDRQGTIRVAARPLPRAATALGDGVRRS